MPLLPPSASLQFGKGAYFADMVSKSAGYCFANRSSPVCCLLLCDVALGEMNEKLQADYNASQLPAGKLSTKGLGRWTPDPSKWQKLEDGLIVPCGPAVEARLPSTPSLLYNEYIVYNVGQVRLRYLLQVKFKF